MMFKCVNSDKTSGSSRLIDYDVGKIIINIKNYVDIGDCCGHGVEETLCSLSNHHHDERMVLNKKMHSVITVRQDKTAG